MKRQIKSTAASDLLTLVLFKLQFSMWMREQSWTAAGANQICKKTQNSLILSLKRNNDTGIKVYLTIPLYEIVTDGFAMLKCCTQNNSKHLK